MGKEECIFCKLLRDSPHKIIAQNNTFFAIYDEFPVSRGHALLIPKRHVESFFDITKEELDDLFELIKKVKEIVDKEFNPDGYNIGVNEGRAAGKTIDHLHIHLIPRYEGDVENPVGGVRNVIPGKSDYMKLAGKK